MIELQNALKDAKSLGEFQDMIRRSPRYNGKSHDEIVGKRFANGVGDIDTSALGFQYAIDTLTYIKKRVVSQKFYEVAPADFIPVVVGEGAFDQSILRNIEILSAGAFEEGDINTGGNNSRSPMADAGISTKSMKIQAWRKAVGYSIMELQQAIRANNWDLIEAKHKSRAKNWQLGIQEVAFLGKKMGNTDFAGLYTQSAVNSDTLTLTAPISTMSVTDFNLLVAALVESYRSNCARTSWPTDFVIPEDDWNGLGALVSTGGASSVSKLEYLQKAFDLIVPNKKVRLSTTKYGMSSENSSRGVSLNRYVMYNRDEDTLEMDIPVDLVVGQPNTADNYNFQDVAYGQYTGVAVWRNLEVLYFDRAA